MRAWGRVVIGVVWAILAAGIGSPPITSAQPVAKATAKASEPNYQGLWWNSPPESESGWGINLAHQGDVIFATWFTYDATGKGMWLVMAATKTANGVYTGTLYRLSAGPAFDADPFPPVGSPGGAEGRVVGTGTLGFADTDNGSFAYTVDGIPQTKTITREVFGPLPTCSFGAQPDLTVATNYQDLWWAAPEASEAGWGVNLTHQGDTIFASWFTYDRDHSPMWLVAAAPKTGPRTYSGTLVRATGPPFNANPFPPVGSPGGATGTNVGTAMFTFADGNNASFAYTVQLAGMPSPVAQTKMITREIFVPPGTVCGEPNRTPSSVAISSPTLSPWQGEALQLTAVARDQFGAVISGTTPTWSSSDPRIATVSATGELRALATGTVVVTATIGSVSATQPLTITPMPRIGVTVGAKEVVIAYNADRCPDGETPDGPPRFVRAEDGSLVMFDGRSYINRGADFGSLKRDCSAPALLAAKRPNPESYENGEMLWAVYREGSRWHALIHNEFHDPVASTCQPPDAYAANVCTYNSITYAVSTQGARWFSKLSPPAHIVAPAPTTWVPPSNPVPVGQWVVEGYFTPTNIVRGSDGLFYSLPYAIPSQSNQNMQGPCAIRTDNLDDPASWRAWDGRGFNLRMTSPYETGAPAPVCTFLKTNLSSGHIVYSTYLNRYMHVGQAQHLSDGRDVCGIFYALSADLIHWSDQKLLAEAKVFDFCDTNPQSPGVLEPVKVWYSSIVDHSDTTINFERAGHTPYLYYVRFNQGVYDRDVMRVPLTFTRLD